MADERDEAVDWEAFAKRLLEGDPLAALELTRMVNRCLPHVRGRDFAQEWDDLIQDVVLSTLAQLQGDGLEDPQRLPGFVKQVTRNKFFDRLRKHLSHGEDRCDAWEEVTEQHDELQRHGAEEERLIALREMHATLPERQQRVMRGVARGLTNEEISEQEEIPLGTVKLDRRQATAALRKLDSEGEGEDP